MRKTKTKKNTQVAVRWSLQEAWFDHNFKTLSKKKKLAKEKQTTPTFMEKE